MYDVYHVANYCHSIFNLRPLRFGWELTEGVMESVSQVDNECVDALQ